MVNASVYLQAIFRAAMLPHPKVNPASFPASTAAFAASALLPLIIFVAYHLVRSPSRLLFHPIMPRLLCFCTCCSIIMQDCASSAPL